MPPIPLAASPSDRAQARAARIEPPTIVLPKGGGALRSIGEKLAVSQATGTRQYLPAPAFQPRASGSLANDVPDV
jgi:hypothetical protein